MAPIASKRHERAIRRHVDKLSKIDRVFNGSMFPISVESRAKVECPTSDLLKSVLLEGQDLTMVGTNKFPGIPVFVDPD